MKWECEDGKNAPQSNPHLNFEDRDTKSNTLDAGYVEEYYILYYIIYRVYVFPSLNIPYEVRVVNGNSESMTFNKQRQRK